MQAFGAATLRVAALGEAVERLSGHLDAARPNDVARLGKGPAWPLRDTGKEKRSRAPLSCSEGAACSHVHSSVPLGKRGMVSARRLPLQKLNDFWLAKHQVSALVEERMAATVRKVQHQCESVFGAQGELLQRLSALEATVVQEQRASLSALEAMIKSPTITRRRSPTTTKRP